MAVCLHKETISKEVEEIDSVSDLWRKKKVRGATFPVPLSMWCYSYSELMFSWRKTSHVMPIVLPPHSQRAMVFVYVLKLVKTVPDISSFHTGDRFSLKIPEPCLNPGKSWPWPLSLLSQPKGWSPAYLSVSVQTYIEPGCSVSELWEQEGFRLTHISGL